MRIFLIKTHDRWQLALIFFPSMILPIYLFGKYGEGYALLASFTTLSVTMTCAYYLLAHNIDVIISDKSIATTWITSFPSYEKKYAEIFFEDIEWAKNYSNGSAIFDSFTIKTRNGEKLSIQYLDFFISQNEYDKFLLYFNNTIVKYNEKQTDQLKKISIAPSVFETTIGRIFAVIFSIILVFIVYTSVKNHFHLDSSKESLKLILGCLTMIIYIGFTIAFYFRNKKKSSTKNHV